MNIVGVGNVLMGDDGVGPAVVTALESRDLPREVNLVDAGLSLSDVLGSLDPADPLVVIDALRGSGAPGTIYEVRLPEGGTALVPPAFGRMVSLHEVGLVQALSLEALSGREFRDVTVFGIEPRHLAWGLGLSGEVGAAVERLVERLCERVGPQCVSAERGDRK